MKLKKIFCICLLAITPRLYAQYTMGTVGLLNIPTADRQESGTVMLGGNFLPKQIMPERFSYNTGNYFVSVSLFSFLEVGFRETLLKSWYMGSNGKFKEQDRSYSIRLCLLKEKKYMPALAIGVNDPAADLGYNTFESYYGVITKGIDLGNHHFSASLGYFLGKAENSKGIPYNNRYDGVFGGICYSPAFYRELKVMAEYDSMGINVGAAVRLWKHLSIHAFTREFNCISAGMRYECTLIH